MPIVSKPKKVNEQLINTFIEKGGSVTSEKIVKKRKDITPLKLNVPTKLLHEIDLRTNVSLVSKTRHAWILEAIIEKIERENIEE